MKVAHINYLPTYLPGIQSRIINQAKVAFNENMDFDFFILNSDLEEVENNIKYKKINFSNFFLIRYVQQKLYRYKIIDSLVPIENYDYIILRYPLAMGFGMKSFYKKWGKMTITEHHTIEEQEIKYYFNNKILSEACSFLERKYKSYVLDQTAGMIGVTNEIIYNNNKPLNQKVVISNGFDVSSIIKSRNPRFENILNIIFIASRFAIWHGLDKVIEAARKYSGPIKINIKIVGSILDKKIKLKLQSFNSRWICFEELGPKNKEELEIIYSTIHLAISSLGLDRIGLKEGSVLKTREYIARSIPFIYAYKDSDLSGDENFAYKINDSTDKIDFNKVINFYLNLDIDKCQKEMKDFAINNIDLKIKVREMWDFVYKISNNF